MYLEKSVQLDVYALQQDSSPSHKANNQKVYVR